MSDEPTGIEEISDGAVVADSEPTEVHTEAATIDVDLPSLEALLFSTHHPLTAARLAELLDVKSVKPVHHSIRDLNKLYEDQGRAFRVEQVAGGYQMLTLPVFADVIKKHQQKEADAKLGKAAIETLAIIAYKQPILRVNIEAIRGVACGETIRGLMEKHLVKIAGRAEEPGRPILYGTTKRFLEVFGLNSLKDLPEQEDALAVKAEQVREAKSQAKNERVAESEGIVTDETAESSLAPSPSAETSPLAPTSSTASIDPESPAAQSTNPSEPQT